jgi:serine/threonine protein kinase
LAARRSIPANVGGRSSAGLSKVCCLDCWRIALVAHDNEMAERNLVSRETSAQRCGRSSALGCVLYQLVTGHPPFYGDTPVAVAYQHVDTDPVPPGELRPALADTFERFLLQTLAKDPAQRPTAEQIALWDPASTETSETGAADEGGR